MLKQAIKQYLFFTVLSLAVTYSLYVLTFFTIGHSLLFFAFLQFIVFILILVNQDRKKKQGIHHILRMVSRFMSGELEDYSSYSPDKDLYVLTRKIKELKQQYQEETLSYKRAQTRFFHILQNIKSAVILVDHSGKIDFINAAGEDFFQVKRMESVEKTHWKIGRGSGLSHKIEEVRKTGESITTEIKLSSQHASKILEATIAPATMNEKGPQEIVILMHDITERGLMDQMRKEFVANVSHELKTPLTSIKGFTETLLDGALQKKEIAERFLTIINSETVRLQEMVNSLLDLSEIESQGIKKEHVNLVALVDQAIEQMRFLAKQKEVTITSDVSSSFITMEGDENRLKQVVINLLSNSINYSEEDKQILVKLEEIDNDITITIQDEGKGIPNEHIERIFERFYRVDSSRNQKSGGRGIGLSIVKQIVKQHGGQIKITSEVDRGTTITIIFKK